MVVLGVDVIWCILFILRVSVSISLLVYLSFLWSRSVMVVLFRLVGRFLVSVSFGIDRWLIITAGCNPTSSWYGIRLRVLSLVRGGVSVGLLCVFVTGL